MSARNIVLALSLAILLLCSCKSEKVKVATADAVDQGTEGDLGSPLIMTEATLDLTEYGIANNNKNVLGGLKVGDMAPDFSLYDHKGKVINLNQKLYRGQVILVFYRADWCPYCSEHLMEFRNRLQEIHQKGYTNVIAVTPQRKAYTAELIKENRFIFPILHDAGHTVMKKYKVFYHATRAYNKKVKKFTGESIQEMNGDKDPVLCVPATYVIGQDMKIKYVHYDPDYSKRADIQEVIDHL